ncbi:hypothetical protein [Rheinheimera sp.]|uniref:hypothetical protein n=1 Tax=Rheinheimera sp. TaxID=1869214 RepID=UPI002FDD5057
MNATVNFLETLGQNSAYRQLDTTELALAAQKAGLSEALIQAILAADQQSVAAMMNTHSKGCFVFVPADEENKEQPALPDDNDEEKITVVH